MNIEVYEKKQKEGLIESKEAIEHETKEARKLCAEYHRKLDKSGYFNSKAMNEAKGLLSKFNKLDLTKLPDSVKAVALHRMAYLELMAGLSQNHNIRDLMDKSEPGVIFGGDIKRIEKMAQEKKEFQKLKEDDIKFAIQKLRLASTGLKPLTKKGNFGLRAKKYLIPPNASIKDIRCDDTIAAKKLREGVDILRKNLSRLYRTKKVLNEEEAPEVANKKRRRAA